MKKIAIIGSVGIPAKYGGFETLVEYLTVNLSSKFLITVFCSSKGYKNKISSYNNTRLIYLPFNANGIQSIFYDILSIWYALFFADVLLILGVSGCIFLPIAKLISNKKIIVNIDGLEWKREKWNYLARKFLKFSESLAVKYSDEIIADNKGVSDYVLKEYGVSAKLIPYGGNHVSKRELSRETLLKYTFLAEKYVFKVCRIEPENNIEMILDAFTNSNQLTLVMVGNWYQSDFGKNMKNLYSNISNIQLLDPIYDQDVLNEIRSNCLFYVHGHSAGGTNPSLVEAMCLGLPVVCFDVVYNVETTKGDAYYFKSSNDLSNIIRTFSKDELEKIANKMELIANEEYVWERISNLYGNLFK